MTVCPAGMCGLIAWDLFLCVHEDEPDIKFRVRRLHCSHLGDIFSPKKPLSLNNYSIRKDKIGRIGMLYRVREFLRLVLKVHLGSFELYR